MLSTLRRVPSRFTCRRFATAVSIVPNVLGAGLDHGQNIAESSSQGSNEIPAKAVALREPVYLAMSSILPPKKKDLLSEKVAVLDPTVFNHPIRRDILHLCVIHHRDGLRQGSASTKTRGEIAGSGRKLRPQKGSGRARLGDRGNPMLRGGGVAFGPKPRDFSTKLPRKVIEMGMRVALSAKVRDQGLGVVSTLAWPGLKTKHLARRIDFLGWRKTLFVTGEEKIPVGLERSGNNIKWIETKTVQDLNVYDVLKWKRLVMDVHAVEWLERKLGKENYPLEAPWISPSTTFVAQPDRLRATAVIPS